MVALQCWKNVVNLISWNAMAWKWWPFHISFHQGGVGWQSWIIVIPLTCDVWKSERLKMSQIKAKHFKHSITSGGDYMIALFQTVYPNPQADDIISFYTKIYVVSTLSEIKALLVFPTILYIWCTYMYSSLHTVHVRNTRLTTLQNGNLIPHTTAR